VEAIQGLKIRRSGGPTQIEKPREILAGLGGMAEIRECLDREGGISNPVESVIPVANAADLLGQ